MEWAVHIENAEVDGQPLDLERLADVADVLDDLSAIVTGGSGHGPAVQLTVTTLNYDEALAHAVSRWDAALTLLEIPAGPVVHVEATEWTRFAAELERPAPALLGVTEIAQLLGVSRQRVNQLRQRPDFPDPIAELAAGSVWTDVSLRHFLEGWERKPGRPGRVTVSHAVKAPVP